jgi:hypothetical protein
LKHFGPSAFRQSFLLAPTGDIRQATCNGKIERGTAVIERPWIRFSEELPRNRLKQPGLSRPVAGLQEPTTHVGGDYALIVANRNRVLRLT